MIRKLVAFAGVLVVTVMGAVAPMASAGSSAAMQRTPSALCRDGTYSYSQHRRGTCSWHGGVAVWLRRVPAVHHHAAKCPFGCTVHVKGYTKKNGTYVAPYNRRPPRR